MPTWIGGIEINMCSTKMNVPVILVGKDKIPPAFYDSSFLKKMFVVRWEGKSPIGI